MITREQHKRFVKTLKTLAPRDDPEEIIWFCLHGSHEGKFTPNWHPQDAKEEDGVTGEKGDKCD